MGIFDQLKKMTGKQNLPEIYSEEEMDAIENYIEATFGKFEEVIHEIQSPDIHVDIAIIPPSKKEEYYKLVTMGMGAHRMNVPRELKEEKLERAELVIYLPKKWKLHSSKEEWYWPIRWMKQIARMPIEEKSWVGYGHTIGCEESFADNTELNGIGLIAAETKEKKAAVLNLPDGSVIHFYQMIPLYQEEMEYKIEAEEIDALLALFDEEEFPPVVNINRVNYCKEYYA